MKTILFILAVFSIILGLSFREEIDFRNNCKDDCIGIFCSCDVTCSDDEVLNCRCGAFSCVCWCESANPKNNSNFMLASVNERQERNLEKAEDYFRGLGQPKHLELANAIGRLKLALKTKNLSLYLQNADVAENVYYSISETDKEGYLVWSGNNLEK